MKKLFVLSSIVLIAGVLSSCAAQNTTIVLSESTQKLVGLQPVACSFTALVPTNIFDKLLSRGPVKNTGNRSIRTTLDFDKANEIIDKWIEKKTVSTELKDYVPTGDWIRTQLLCVWVTGQGERRQAQMIALDKNGSASITRLILPGTIADKIIENSASAQ